MSSIPHALGTDGELPLAFGPYLLLKRLGSGGMANVFLAKARGIGGFEKLICIKCIRSVHAGRDEFIHLLIEEAKIVSHIVHPNVAQVFDLGMVDDQYYIAMEYVDGIDAYRMLTSAVDKEVLLPPPAVAWILRDMANGLAAAHEQKDHSGAPLGIIHRDISPHNVLISYSGDVKIIDFGVAKATLRAQQTEAGVIKGKYNYLSPEQASGKQVDHRSDVFSAGIVLYELLAGEPRYVGDHIAELLDQARRARTPSLRRIRKDVPKDLVKVMERALKKDVSKRYDTAAQMAAELDAVLLDHYEGYGRRDFIELIEWLFPGSDRDGFEDKGPASLERMDRGDFLSHSKVSIVAAPDVQRTDEPPEEWEAAPTLVAGRREVLEAPPDHETRPIRPRRTRGKSRRLLWALVASLFTIGLATTGAALLLLTSAPEPVLEVLSVPEGAQIYLDGRLTGQVTPGRLTRGLERGRRSLRLHKSGYEPWEGVVEVGDEPAQVRVALQRARATLWIRSTPPGALVRIDGQPRGQTPLELGDLDTADDVRIELSLDGYLPFVSEHQWGDQNTATVHPRLVRVDAP